MRLTFAVLAAVATTVVAQGVTEILTPTSSPPPQCNPSYSGKFELTVQALSKRGIEERQKSGLLTCTLENGILTDSDNRTGYIASNFQFQFDGPPQAGAIYTAGWTICANDSLALGGSAVFYQCLSGSFYNLYDRYWAGQCQPVNLQIIPLGGGSTTAVDSGASQTASVPSGSALSQNSNGAPVATGVSNATSLATASGNVTMTASPTMSTASQSAAKTSSSSAKSSSSSGLAAIATPLANLGALAIGLIGAVAVL